MTRPAGTVADPTTGRLTPSTVARHLSRAPGSQVQTLVVRQLGVILLIAIVAGQGLANVANLALIVVMDIVWELLWLLVKVSTRGLPISVTRTFLVMHVLLVQIGLVVIHVFAHRPRAVAGLYLEFTVQPSLRVVLVPTLFFVFYTAGSALAVGSGATAHQVPRIEPVKRDRADGQWCCMWSPWSMACRPLPEPASRIARRCSVPGRPRTPD